MRTTIILARHGQTIWNKERRFQGQTDIPLSKEGVKQAKALAKRIKNLKISKIYTSQLKRAIHTADIIAKPAKLTVEKIKELNERSYGAWEGLFWEDKNKELNGSLKACELDVIPEGGESLAQVQKGILGVFNPLIKKHQGETILIVCHGIVIRVLISHLTKLSPKEVMEKKIPNTSISIFYLEDNGKIIEEVIGDASHLEN
jgi:phosphoserine phosphatase